jgi:single-strand DNA-binding protein
MFNKVILMGRICHDLELKTTPNGVSVLSFRIAVDRNYQVKGEERKADFFNVVTWRSTAEFVNRYFGKGRMIMIDGELQTRQYVDKNGVTQNIVEIVADTIHFTGERPNQNNNNGGQMSGGGNYGGNSYGNGGGNYGGGNSYGGGSYGGSYQNNSNNANISHPAETANAAPAPISGGNNSDFASTSNDDDDYPF